MNTLKEEKNEYEEENDRIKVYLKIKPSIASDKIFYNVSKNKKVLTLLDNITLDDHKKTNKIEVDKIFANKEENSYLYEEIMRNCVKNSLNGENYTIISYGDSYSEKHNLIIGTPDCYENINNRGIFPRLLESYINKIDSNEILSDTISLNLSYIMINDNNLIDLTQLMGIETKSFEKLSKEEYLKKYSKEIKIDEKNNIYNSNFLKTIKKTPVETVNDSLFFLLQILNLFYKLEATNNHFLTWSYFIIILYVTDNNGKTVSTINFIILPGNEILLHKNVKRKSISGEIKKDVISMTLKNNAIECFNTIEDILGNMQIEQEENKQDKNKENKRRASSVNKKKEIKSKFFHIMGKLSFDVNNISAQYDRKYVIIGSIFGNSGYITNTKDTLNFLTLCKKLSGQKISNNKRQSFIDTNFFTEKLKAKNDQIYDLESKLKTQEAKVKELNNLMDNKEENYKALQENYKVQIKSLKKELGFYGDIENLLKKNENSEDYEFALKIRNLTENNKLKNIKIEELKEQIVQIETVIQQLRTLLDVKENDFTMLDIVRSVREAKEKKREDMKIRNKTGDKIEDLQKKNKILENKINGLKNELESKKNIINSLPEIFTNNMNANKNLEKLEHKINDDNATDKWFGNKKNDVINDIKTESNKEKQTIINKYENILTQNKNSIKDQNKKLNNITDEFKKIKKGYLDELVVIYKNIINIINHYRKCFQNNNSIFLNKEKFDKILEREEKVINPILLPLLYVELGKIGYGHFQLNNKKIKPSKKVIKSKFYKNTFEEDDLQMDNDKKDKKKLNYLNKNEKNKKINNIINILTKENNLNSSNDLMLPLDKEMIDKKNIIFSKLQKKTDNQLINMALPDIQQYCKNNMKKMAEIENFINTYFKGKNKFDNFEPTKERAEEINKEIISINNNIKLLYDKYQNNTILFQKGDKTVQNLINENNILKKKINDKLKNKVFIDSKLKLKNHFNKANSQAKVQNYYNSILTTTSSNNGGNPLFIHNSTKVFSDNNSTRGTNEKIDFNLTENNAYYNNNPEFLRKRPTSSINKVNPYFFIVEN